MTIGELLNELIYRSYAYNRRRSLEIPPEKWAIIFSNADELERQFQEEIKQCG